MDKKENCYFLFNDMPVHCEYGHRTEIVGLQKEKEEKLAQEKKRHFLLTVLCEKCDNKLMTFNVVIAIERKIAKTQFLPKIKGMPTDRHAKKISR